MEEFYRGLSAVTDEGDLQKIEAYLKEQAASMTGIYQVLPQNELGSLYRGLGRYEESLASFGRARAVLSAYGMEETEQYATVLINEATLLRLMKRYDESIRTFEKARGLTDRDSYVYVSLINNMALTCLETGDTDAAEKLLLESEGWNASHPTSEHEIGVTAVNLASIYIGRGDWANAKIQTEKAFAAFDSMEETDVHYAAALSARAAIAVREGRTEDARRDYEEAMRLTERFFGRNPEYETAKKALEGLNADTGTDAP